MKHWFSGERGASGDHLIALARHSDALLADKASYSNWIIEEMNARGATICISQRPQRKAPLEIDEEMYRWRHLVENSFCDLKDFRRIAPRTDRTDISFAAIINECAAPLNSK